jgi:hypothetical protein
MLLAAMSVSLSAGVSAHRLDEYLQAARIAVERDRVQLELNLTPGIAVADGIIREIDADGDGELSLDEQHSYADRVLSAVTLHVDDAPHHLKLATSTFPDVVALRSGDSAITLRSEVLVPLLSRGPHRVFFRNGNATVESVYLANALVPENDLVAVTGQQRDGQQSELTIDVRVRGTPAASVWMGLTGGLVLALLLTWRTRERTASRDRRQVTVANSAPTLGVNR